MSKIEDLADEIAGLWARECQAEEAALATTDPLLRSNHEKAAATLAGERKALHELISRLPAATLKDALILSLFAADLFAQLDAGRTDRNTPLRHLHNSIIAALEAKTGITREDLGLGFLWISDHDGPGQTAA